MKLANLTIKVIFLVLVGICVQVGHSAEETKPFLERGENTLNRIVNKNTLRESATVHSSSFDLKKVKEHHAKQFEMVDGVVPKLGLLAVINLSSVDLSLLHYEIGAQTTFITVRGYKNTCDSEKISLSKENTTFINLHTCQGKNGEDLYFIRSEIFSSYSPMFCNVFTFGEYDRADKRQIIEGILNRFARYAQEGKGHRLDERTKNEPELASYLQNPEEFSASLKKKNLIFFYENKIPDLS